MGKYLRYHEYMISRNIFCSEQVKVDLGVVQVDELRQGHKNCATLREGLLPTYPQGPDLCG